ncbi:MAG: hypothetical protein ACOY94_08525 [Bacillota bacterium]
MTKTPVFNMDLESRVLKLEEAQAQTGHRLESIDTYLAQTHTWLEHLEKAQEQNHDELKSELKQAQKELKTELKTVQRMLTELSEHKGRVEGTLQGKSEATHLMVTILFSVVSALLTFLLYSARMAAN